jgi:methylmalonyl-CoA mutase
MTNPEQSLSLAADFPAATSADWRQLVDGVLKGTPFARLISTTYDKLTIEPLAARRPDARPIAARAGARPWQVMARIDHPDPALANAAALEELENGATGLSLVFASAVGGYGFGLPPREDTLARVLEGVDPAGDVAVELDMSPQADAVIDAALAQALISFRQIRQLRIGHDPLGAMAVIGSSAQPWPQQAPHFGRRLAALAREGFDRQKLAAADGRVIHNAGGSEAQELAYVLAVALAYLRTMESAGLPLEQARRMIFFRLAADADQFLTMAKFRALRKLWAQVEAACGLAPEATFISAETAWRMMTQRDPQTNILRATIAVFSAALGGADAISALPFPAALGLSDDFARRVARNTQLVLLEESNLAKVADPAAGSGAVEDLTDQLCRAAWLLFQEIETAGGAAAALESGLIQKKVAAVRAQREAAVARLDDVFTGVSIFPDLNETSAQHTILPYPLPEAGGERPIFALLQPIRLAQPFETLRDASDRRLAAAGARPKIFLACLGRQADFTARATFAKNFFEAGGIETVSGQGDASALSAAFASSGAAIACLCGADKVYASEAAPIAGALKKAGVKHLYLVGRPGDRETVYRSAGVDSFIYTGCDALPVLESAHHLIAP